MIIRGMRWGYDGGGVACGPVEGNTIVEIVVTNKEHHNFFIVVSRMSEFERVFVSPVPLFDILIESNHYNVEFETEFNKCESNAIEDYDYEISDIPEEMSKSEFSNAFKLARMAMEEYYGSDNISTDYETAQAFIKEYIGQDIDDMEFPEVTYGFKNEEEGYNEEKCSNKKHIFALETEKDGFHDIQPCDDKDTILLAAEEVWDKMTVAEKSSYTIFRVIKTEQFWSEVIGPVYGEPVIIKDFK